MVADFAVDQAIRTLGFGYIEELVDWTIIDTLPIFKNISCLASLTRVVCLAFRTAIRAFHTGQIQITI